MHSSKRNTYYKENYYKTQLELEKEKNNDIIANLKNKITMLENKTNRLQSMNEVFLDLLKKQQRSIDNNNRNSNINFHNDYDYDNYIMHKYRNRYDDLDNIYNNPINNEFERPKLRKSSSQIDMFSIKDIKYYKEPIKLMQEQLKAYIFQTTLDRRREEYLLNEQINDIKNEVNNRLTRLENQHKLQLNSLANSINNGGYNFDSLANRLSIYQRERENFEEFMDEKLNKLANINNSMNNNRIDLNNKYNYNNYNNNYNNNNDYFE